MANLLAQGVAWLGGKRHTSMAGTITYVRGVDTVSLSATVGKTDFEQLDESGVVQRIESRDFLIRTADLVLAAVTTLPRAGDLIRETEGPQTFVYEVMAPGDEPPWRYSGAQDRSTLRIHTKHVATE